MAFAISTIAMALGVILFPSILVPISILLFSSMDAIGYFHLVWGGDQSQPVVNQQERLVSYRFIQVGFQVLLSLVLYSFSGVLGPILFNIMWWFGLCDMLYYILLKQKFIQFEDMFWLWWTPAGVLKRLGLIDHISGTTMIIQAAIGVLLSVSIAILW
jgi:hypothetical protein